MAVMVVSTYVQATRLSAHAAMGAPGPSSSDLEDARSASMVRLDRG